VSAWRLFWTSVVARAWTHAGYPLAAAGLARLRERRVARGDATSSVSLIVAAHDEEDVVVTRAKDLLQLDYPPELLNLVASDAVAEKTEKVVEEVAAREPRVLRCPRGGKVAAQNLAVKETGSEMLAFSDANVRWEPDTLRKHRLLRYRRGLLHLARLGTSLALRRRGPFYDAALAALLAGLGLALAGRLCAPIPGVGFAYYYALVTWATMVALAPYARFGVLAVLERAEGTG
jgi:cellulose synthase/poly-beta-1,6-N-acetylglucosamine synthase-like glycosyltransferase